MAGNEGPIGWLRRALSGDANDPDYRTGLLSRDGNSWRHRHAQLCLTVDELPTSKTEHRLAEERDTLTSTNLGEYLFKEMMGSQVARCEVPGMVGILPLVQGAGGVYQTDRRAIEVMPVFSEGGEIVVAAHEYRHGWQDYQLGIADMGDLTKRDYAAQLMMVEADARAFSVGLAWQLKEGGDPRAWDAVLNDPVEHLQANAFQSRIDAVRERDGPEAAKSDEAISAAMGDAYNVWFETEENYGPYVQQIETNFAAKGENWTGTKEMRASFGPMVGRLPGRTVGDASYLGMDAVDNARTAALLRVPSLSAADLSQSGNQPGLGQNGDVPRNRTEPPTP
ncbi:MAG: hypothetical protein KI792_08995 [Alphaproteobacteria bacterium]|nr:hypothetical protein [Alphaproteobacteria bacterium SS10]